MSYEHHRRGRNWFTAMGALFCIMAGIVMVQQLLVWGPEFMLEFLMNNEITHEKISVAMFGFGAFMMGIGFLRVGNNTKRD